MKALQNILIFALQVAIVCIFVKNVNNDNGFIGPIAASIVAVLIIRGVDLLISDKKKIRKI